MSLKPILFSTLMVQAILAGRKTQTRRIIKSRHESGLFQICRNNQGIVTSINSLDWDERNCEKDITPKYKTGDILYVRESFFDYGYWELPVGEGITHDDVYWTSMKKYLFVADVDSGHKPLADEGFAWRKIPSIHMPKSAARIFLKVTKVRVEKANDISEADAIAEGVESENRAGYVLYKDYSKDRPHTGSAIISFNTLWNSINGPETWNNWVFVYDFEITEKP